VESVLPTQFSISFNLLLGLTVILFFVLLVFLILYIRTTRRFSKLQSSLSELSKLLQHSNNKVDTITHQHGAIVDNIKSVELVISKDVDALRHELVRQVEKIFDLSDEEFARATEILIPRLEAYKKLWEITESVYNLNGSIESPTKENIIADLNAWYFEEGNGIFLSSVASDILRTAIRAIKNAPLADVKASFSELRVQLKNDIGLYDEIESEKLLENLSA